MVGLGNAAVVATAANDVVSVVEAADSGFDLPAGKIEHRSIEPYGFFLNRIPREDRGFRADIVERRPRIALMREGIAEDVQPRNGGRLRSGPENCFNSLLAVARSR